MLIRTVLDCRKRDPKFIASVLLLAASWAERVKPRFALCVVITGDAPDPLLRFFDSHGIRWQIAEPDPDLAFVPTGNTLLGGYDRGPHDRIMLVDNDVYFLGALKDLDKIAPDVFAGAPAGFDRVTVGQWGLIAQNLNLAPLEQGWISPGEQLKNRMTPGSSDRQIPHTYVNGGVLLLPQDKGFVTHWRADILEIAQFFQGGPHQSVPVCKSNMAGLATAIGRHGRFQWLDDTFNYRHLHVLLNRAPFEDISILHMTGYPNHAGGFTVDRHVSEYVALYWQNRIAKRLSDFEGVYDRATLLAVQHTLACCVSAMLRSVAEFDLDAIMADILHREQSAL